MNDCLTGKKELPDYREKGIDWDVFTDLMLATWIRRFTRDNPVANEIAKRWAETITVGFSNGIFDRAAYIKAYIYANRIAELPNIFESKSASCYLHAIELLSKYRRSKQKLRFVSEWLNDNRNENGKWDMGNSVNDKVYFPLSDNWRKK